MKYAIAAICCSLVAVSAAQSSNNFVQSAPYWEPISQEPYWAPIEQNQEPYWAPIEEARVVSSNVDRRSLRCMADNIYHEARGDTRQGQIAVGLVVMNRVKSRHFPNTPCRVIWERAQFSWTLDRSLWKIRNPKAYRVAEQIAREVLSGQHSDFTNGATHYYQPDLVNPAWSKSGVDKKKIGAHLFMKMESGGR